MYKRIMSGVMLILFLLGTLSSGSTIQLFEAEPETSGADQKILDKIASHYDNVTFHEGDLIINGTKTYVVEECSFIQTGDIYVKDNGTLAIKKAELVMNMSRDWEYNIYVYDAGRMIVEDGNLSTPIIFDINFFDRSSGEFSNSIIGGGWTKLGYVCLEIRNRSLSEISIRNCSVYFLRTYSDSSNIEITDWSDITCFSIKWISCNLSISGLRSCHIKYWNSYMNASVVGQCSNVTILNSRISWSEMFFDRSNASVAASEINSMWCLTASNVTIANTTGAWIHSADASEVNIYNITCHQYLALSGSKTKISLHNLRLYRIWGESFQGIIFSENVMVETILFLDSQFYTWGNFSYVEDTCVEEWTNSDVTRNFNVIVTNETSNPLADVELKLLDQNNNIVWSGLSDNHGKASFNLTFSDTNHTETLKVKAVLESSWSVENVAFFSKTPIMIVLPYTPVKGTATLEITPNTLNLKSKGRWITAYIELPEGYCVNNINVCSILLNDTVPVDPNAPTEIGDYDEDGIPDLMVKFSRAEVISNILANINMTKLYKERFITGPSTITGVLSDGTVFEGNEKISIRMPMSRGLRIR